MAISGSDRQFVFCFFAAHPDLAAAGHVRSSLATAGFDRGVARYGYLQSARSLGDRWRLWERLSFF